MLEVVIVANPFDEGEVALSRIAHRHGFSSDAAHLMRAALEQGHGAMAQFDHPEFGGFGQWMRGGMITLSSPTEDVTLEARVDALCCELADLAATPTMERTQILSRER